MFAAILAFGLTLGSHKPPCVTPVYATCANARLLAASPDFQDMLKRFLGDTAGNYRQVDRSLYKEVIDRMFDPYAPPRDIGGGARLFPGCRFAACPEKAAIIMDRTGVLAIGVLDYHSDFNPGLDVIVERSGPLTTARAAVLKAWADQAVAEDAARLHGPIALKGVQIRALREETALATPIKSCSRVALLIRRCHLG
jgi:hypothetical protein